MTIHASWPGIADLWSQREHAIAAFMSLRPTLDLAASMVFAVTGALVASRKQLDIVGFMWLGVVTGVGGGTVRDLLLGVPVFWVQDATVVVGCVIASAATHFVAHLVHSRHRTILWLDAMGLALVTIAGAAKGIDHGAGPVVSVMMGVLTAALGGIIRDIIGQEPSIILRREIYVTAALAGAIAYVALAGLGADRAVAALTGGLIVPALRGLAIARGWSLPVYRPRRGRSVDETS